MSKARSPSYPIIGLGEAIQKIEAVYQQDYQNSIPRAVVAKHMGYNTLNGKSLGVLAAVSKFGLLEGRGDNSRVSDLAVTVIAHAPGAPERVEALRQAAASPGLFRELDERFQGGKGSDTAIRAYLLTKKFIPGAADTAIRAYRETKQLVEQESKGYDPTLVAEHEPMPPVIESGKPPASPSPRMPLVTPTPSLQGSEIANIRVSKDCAIRLVADGPYSKRSIEALVKQLQLGLELGSYDDAEGWLSLPADQDQPG